MTALVSLVVAGLLQACQATTPTPSPADRPAPRTDANSTAAHAELLAKAKAGRIDVYFVGDSIIRRWGATDYPELLANWRANFRGWNAANFGWGADRTENILWRLENGELDGVNPKVIVVLAGTNNVGPEPGDEDKVADITRGLEAIRDVCRRKAPGATIILTAIFPRNDNMAVMPEIDRINRNLAAHGRRRAGALPERQRQARRPAGQAFRRHDARARQAAPDAAGISGVGRRVEADPHGVAGTAGGHRPRAAADWRSERAEAAVPLNRRPLGQRR